MLNNCIDICVDVEGRWLWLAGLLVCLLVCLLACLLVCLFACLFAYLYFSRTSLDCSTSSANATISGEKPGKNDGWMECVTRGGVMMVCVMIGCYNMVL